MTNMGETQQQQQQQQQKEALDLKQPLHGLEIQSKETQIEEEEPLSLPTLDGVEEILGYKFSNKGLLERAFTHASFPDKDFSYERLEYAGDSVLNLLFTKELYFKYPDLSPGALTRLRAANVDTEKLARVAIKHGLHRFLRHKKPLLEEQIREFSQEILEFPLHSYGLIDVPKALADVVESTVGAVFIDSNCSTDAVWKVFKDLLEPIITQETLGIHPVTELHEVCQKRNLKLYFEDLWRDRMTFNVFIDYQLVGTGTYALKKEIAQNRAAKDALNNIGRILREKDGVTFVDDLQMEEDGPIKISALALISHVDHDRQYTTKAHHIHEATDDQLITDHSWCHNIQI